ncbi:ABC transporter ATP-binding protein [Microbacterium sp. PMB16]|uniref:ABC transporter ATP-binding protein n=1 Tax=Microbacterium sp. PMB16 TaxID=3120157 RepID=UPI003F4BCE8A
MAPILRDVSMRISPGEALGVVGESGSGKSMTLRSIAGLLPAGAQRDGVMTLDGLPLGEGRTAKARRALANDVGFIFQDARAHINPMRTVGDFLCEGLVTVKGVPRREAMRRAEKILSDVGIRDAVRRLGQYPHELSGGMLQRVMIASVLLAQPRLILADEPTTALDVTTQSEVMAILDEERKERGMAMIFVTHDLELAAAVCDRIAVMYAGSIVEEVDAASLHERAVHPYTRALLASRPELGRKQKELTTVPGNPISASEVPADTCAFAPRCPLVTDRCVHAEPRMRPNLSGAVACFAVDGSTQTAQQPGESHV